jgi:hypothetical protein
LVPTVYSSGIVSKTGLCTKGLSAAKLPSKYYVHSVIAVCGFVCPYGKDLKKEKEQREEKPNCGCWLCCGYSVDLDMYYYYMIAEYIGIELFEVVNLCVFFGDVRVMWL